MVIAGVAQQGLWALQGGSDQWSQLGQGSGSAEITNRTGWIEYDPDDPETFWESGNYNGQGVYRTDDNGATFQSLGNTTHLDVVSVDWTDPLRQTLLVGVHEQPTLYRSTGGGQSWTNISTNISPDVGQVVAPLIIDATTYVVGTRAGSESGILRSTDGGAAWTTVFEAGVVGTPLVAQTDGTIYWLLDDRQGMVASTDGGLSWQPTGQGPGSPISLSIQQMADGSIVAIGGGALVISSDGGATWQSVGPPLPYEPNGFTYSAARNAFYAWRFDCAAEGDNDIAADSIIRLDVLP